MAGTDKQTQPKRQSTQGEAPQSTEHTDGPGMTGGVPDAMDQGEAKGAPNSDRHETETAGGSGG